MKFAQRMVLIPESEYLSLKSNSTQPGGQQPERSSTNCRIKKRKIESPFNSISQYFSSDHHSKVSAIENTLLSSGVSWNSNFEVTSNQGHRLENSNLIDLLKYMLTSVPSNPGRPTGYPEFIRILSQTTIPVAIFSRRAARDAITQARSASTWEPY